jgi:hypothetical protein
MRSYETLGGLSVRGEDRILAMITHPSHRHGLIRSTQPRTQADQSSLSLIVNAIRLA